MDIKVLHIVGGHSENGAFKGAKILHKALLKAKIKSKILIITNFQKYLEQQD